jgi:hypothetical protein
VVLPGDEASVDICVGLLTRFYQTFGRIVIV